MIEAQRCIALLEDAGASEGPVLDGGSFGGGAGAAVLGDYDGVGGEEGLGLGAEEGEGGGVLLGCVVGGVEEEDVEGGNGFGGGFAEPGGDWLGFDGVVAGWDFERG